MKLLIKLIAWFLVTRWYIKYQYKNLCYNTEHLWVTWKIRRLTKPEKVKKRRGAISTDRWNEMLQVKRNYLLEDPERAAFLNYPQIDHNPTCAYGPSYNGISTATQVKMKQKELELHTKLHVREAAKEFIKNNGTLPPRNL